MTSVDADIVAGGGSGGVGMMGGGGGGGGQLVEVRTQTVTGGSSYPITVGAGGAAAAVVSTRVNGNNGADSSAFGYTAKGGLGGSGQDNGSNAGAPGGGSYRASIITSGAGTVSTTLNTGGTAGISTGTCTPSRSGGGGASPAANGYNGALTATDTPATSSFGADGYSTGTITGALYGAGGAGARETGLNTDVAVGGAGGGGNGSRGMTVSPTAGKPGTGSGGGGNGGQCNVSGAPAGMLSGAGGSGTVVIRYLTPVSPTTPACVPTRTYTQNGATYEVYSNPGTCVFTVPVGTSSLSADIVGGGGGGGLSVAGAGGGAGGQYLGLTNFTVFSGQTITVNVGEGGAGAAAATTSTVRNGSDGQATSFGTFTAAGGKGGLGSNLATGATTTQGSGGATAAATNIVGTGSASTAAVLGGAAGSNSGTASFTGGCTAAKVGGGGAGAGATGYSGTDATAANRGLGGAGYTSLISGTVYGGGGGGHREIITGMTTAAAGGTGGGGQGGVGASTIRTYGQPTNGTDGLGGGGGAAGGQCNVGFSPTAFSAGRGGSGAVVIKYAGEIPTITLAQGFQGYNLLKWNQAADTSATGYRIFWATSADSLSDANIGSLASGNIITVTGLTTTSYKHTMLAVGTPIYYRLAMTYAGPNSTTIAGDKTLTPISVTPTFTDTTTFEYTGNSVQFSPPSGTQYMQASAAGADGGAVTGTQGKGGLVTALLPVAANDTFYITVGSTPAKVNNVMRWGYNGGGTSSANTVNSGGGGATDLRKNGSQLTDRILVAGGGGGYGVSSYGGAGGGLTGSNDGGNQNSGGTQSGAGPASAATPKLLGTAGAGANTSASNGGGGGGGWYGGNAGTSYGGGGGSSYAAPSLLNVTHTQGGGGTTAGDGQLSLTYKSATGKVTGVTAIPDQEQNTLSWDKSPITGVTGYKVYGGTSTNPSTLLATISGVGTTMYVHTGLTLGTTYYYRVTATIPAVTNVSGALETPVAAATEVSATPALTQTQSFTYTGAAQTFTVPAGINWIYVNASGAAGGYINGNWGTGGKVTGWVPVTPGETLNVFVGSQPKTVNGTIAAGWNGGGTTTYASINGWGGGATDIRRSSTTLSARILVAGGGGGTGVSSWGGPGGGLIGSNDTGTQVAGGTQSGPGNWPGTTAQVNGQLGQGANSTTGNGAGGGGGYWGGNSATSYGGGGGSSYVIPTAKAVTHTQGGNSGDGALSITWLATPTVVTNVQAIPDQEQNVITWDKPAITGVTGYKVYGGTTTNPTTVVGTITSANTLSFTHVGLTLGTTYYYRVTATIPVNGSNAAIETVKSSEVSATPVITQSKTFKPTGAMQTFTVPAGVSWVYVNASGAAAGGTNSTWGAGGNVKGWLPVTPGQVLNLFVGRQPDLVNGIKVGGWNGGGTSNYSDIRGLGGDATDIRVGGTTLSSRVIVAGGGGGLGTGSWGGAGGGLVGQNDAAAQVGGGTQSGPGAWPGTTAQVNGQLGQGANSTSGNGGAGGGGYWGGNSATSYGGAGGSSYTGPGVVAVTHTQGTNSGTGSITLTWAANPNIVVGALAIPSQSQNLIAWDKSDITGVTGYKVYASTTAGFTPAAGNLIATITGVDTRSYTHTALTNGTTYYYRITATVPVVGSNAAIETSPSAQVAATPNFLATETFNSINAAQTWVVPPGVTWIKVDANGGAGGYTNGTWGTGGNVKAYIPVTPGETLQINVGGAAATVNGVTSAGWNGGGSTTYASINGYGGGASDVRRGGTALANRVLVAGGGGGTGVSSWGGCGGGLIGSNDTGNQVAGGTQTGPGVWPGTTAQVNGQLGQGANSTTGNGGGGGGGYWGGNSATSYGGGGGSSYLTPDAEGTSMTCGGNAAAGSISITYPTVAYPTGVVAIPGQGFNTISWDPTKITGATGYKIYAGTSPSSLTAVAGTVAIGTNYYKATGLTLGTTYYYRVSVMSGTLESQQSALVQATPSLTVDKTFNYTGTAQSFTVPSGVAWINVSASGASGGYTNGNWGTGGKVTALMPVTPGEVFQVNVGSAPATTNGSIVPGWNGGGTTTYASINGWGGGATDIRRNGTALTNRILVAGGGGGTGVSSWGGYGGSLIGNQDSGGQVAGGTQSGGGNSPGSTAQVFSKLGLGTNSTTGNGGGGGGGYWGGNAATSYGGGGGSSYADPASRAVVHTQGGNTGNGSVTITYQLNEAPQQFAAIAGSASVTLDWNPSALSGLLGYKLYRGTTPGTGTLLATITAPTTNYVDTTAVNGTTYYYRVAAYATVNAVTTEGASTAEVIAKPSALTTLNFASTRAAQNWTVPAGVSWINVVANGAAGGYQNGTWGTGGVVKASIPVTPGEVLQINVGAKPSQTVSTITPGWNGSGNSTYASINGYGGGATDIRRGGTAVANRILVAGGGGGTGVSSWGGCGGGLVAGNDSGAQVGGGTQSGPGQWPGTTAQVYGLLGQGTNSTTGNGGGGGGGYWGGNAATSYGGGGGSSYLYPAAVLNSSTCGGNAGDGSLSISYAIDTTAPSVSGVSSAASTAIVYRAGMDIAVDVNFTEPVVVRGTPTLTVNAGTRSPVLTYASGSGTNALRFIYTVQPGDATNALDIASTAALALNGGTIADPAGNNATLTLASPAATGSLRANRVLVVDAIVPAAPQLVSAAGVNTIQLNWTANTESDLDHYNIYVSNDATNFAGLGNSAAPSTSFTQLIVARGITYYYYITAVDIHGNESPRSAIVSWGIPFPGTTMTPAVIFNTPTSQLKPTITGTADPGATVTIKSGGTVIGTAVADATTGAYSFTPANNLNVGTNVITAYATLGGASSADSIAQNLVIDRTAPGFTSITNYNPATGSTSANDLTWRFTFTEAISTPTAAAFVVTGTTAPVMSVLPAPGVPNAFDVRIFGGDLGNATGTVSIALASNAVITDIAGNALAVLTPTGANQSYIMNGRPQATITSGNTPVKSGDTRTISFTLSTPSTDFAATGVTVSGGTLTNFVGTGSDYTATFTPNANFTGTATIEVRAGVFHDVSNTVNIAATPLVLNVDTVAPTATSSTFVTTSSLVRAGAVLQMSVTFTENVTVTGTPKLGLALGSTQQARYVSGDGTNTLVFEYTVVAGDNSADLNYWTSNALDLTNGSITDTAGNLAVATLPATSSSASLGGSANVVVDTTAPTAINALTNWAATGGTVVAGYVNSTNTKVTASANYSGDAAGGKAELLWGTAVIATTTNLTATSGVITFDTRTTAAADLQALYGLSPPASGSYSVRVTDAAGNFTAGIDTTTRRVDFVAPSVTSLTVAAGTGANGTVKTGNTVEVRLTLSEATTTVMTSAAITVSGTSGTTTGLNAGTLGTLTGGASNLYTTDFRPAAGFEGTANFSLAAGAFTDAAGNPSLVFTPITRQVDTKAPALTLAASVSTRTSNDSIVFTLTEGSSPAQSIDCTTVSGVSGVDFNFSNIASIDSIVQSAPNVCTITVTANVSIGSSAAVTLTAASGFSVNDLTGNSATTFTAATQAATTVTIAPQAPSAPSITSVSGGVGQAVVNYNAPTTTNGAAITDYLISYSTDLGLTWTSFAHAATTSTRQTVTGLTAGVSYVFQVSAVNSAGTSSASSQSSPVTPTYVTLGSPSLTVSGGTVVSGTLNLTNTNLAVTSSLSAALPQTATAEVRVGGVNVTGAEATIVAGATSVTVNVLGSANASDLQAAIAAGGDVSIRIVDSLGNQAVSANSTLKVNYLAPTVSITSSRSALYGSQTATITFSTSTSTSNLSSGDLQVTNGAGSLFAGSGTSYTAVFTPSSSFGGSATITIPAGAFTDADGNPNTAATLTLTVDTVPPVVTLTTRTATATSNSVTFELVSNKPLDCSSVSQINGVDLTFAGLVSIDSITAAGNSCLISATGSFGIGATGNAALSAAGSFSVQDANGNIATTVAVDNASVAVTIPAQLPTAPLNLSATASDHLVFLTWQAPAFNGGAAITDYNVEFSSDSGSANPSWLSVDAHHVASTGTALQISVPANAVAYSFRVSAINSVGVGPATTLASTVTPFGVPFAPTNLTAQVRVGSATLSWTAAANNGAAVTGYQYSLDAGATWSTTSSCASLGASGCVSQTVRGLASGLAYTLQVRAVNQAGAGATAEVRVVMASAPQAPVIIGFTAGDQTIRFSFIAPADDGGSPVTAYEYSTGAVDSGNQLIWVNAPLTDPMQPIALGGLVNGQIYSLQVRAQNLAGWSLASPITAATPISAPSAPSVTSITPGDSQLSYSLDLRGIANGAAISNVEYSLDGTNWYSVGNATGNVVVPGLTNGTGYSLQFRATNRVGVGAAVTATSATPAGVPLTPVFSVFTPGNGSFNITVSAADNGSAITGWKYRIRENATACAPQTYVDQGVWGSWLLLTLTNGSALITESAAGVNLVNGTCYQVQVIASNAIGDSAASRANGIPKTVPGAPIILSGTALNTLATISVRQPADDGGDPITMYSYSIDGAPTVGVRSTDGLFTITGLANGHSYSITFFATNAEGTSVASNAVVVTPIAAPDAPSITGVTAKDGVLTLALDGTVFNGGSAITGYQWRVAGIGSWNVANWTSGNSIDVPGLTNGVQYAFEVRSQNQIGFSPASGASVATAPGAAPDAPTLLLSAGDSRISVAIQPGLSGGYPIFQYETRVTGGSYGSTGTWTSLPLISNPLQLTSLSNGTVYTVEVRALNRINGVTQYGAIATVSGKPVGPASAPQNVTVVAGVSSALVSFNTPATNGGSPLTGFEYSIDNGANWTAVTLSTGHVSVRGGRLRAVTPPDYTTDLTNLNNGVTYTVQVRANTADYGAGQASQGTPVTPMAAQPNAPTITSIVPGRGELTVNFTPPNDNGSVIFAYEYQLNNGSWITSSWTSGTSFTILGLVNNTTYAVKIRAVNAVNPSNASLAVNGTPSGLDAALATISGYTTNPPTTAPNLQDFTDAGITGVNSNNLAAINSILASLAATGRDSVVEIQAIVDAYNAILGAADGVNNTPSGFALNAAQLSALGFGSVSTTSQLALASSVIDNLVGTAVATQAQLAATFTATNKIMAAVGGNFATLTAADFAAMGISGVTAGNLAAVQASLATVSTANQVDSYAELLALVNTGIANAAAADATSQILAYNGTNTAPSLSTFATAGITGVNASNLAGILAYLASSGTNPTSAMDIQDLVNAYNALTGAANGVADASGTVSQANFAALGITTTTAPATPDSASLLSGIVDTRALTAVDTPTELAALNTFVNGVFATAAGNAASPALTAADFAAAGFTGVTDANLSLVLAAIAATADNGTGVDTFAELQSVMAQGAAKSNAISLVTNTTPAGAPNLTVQNFLDAGIGGVSSSNIAAINTLLASISADPTQRDTLAEVQAIVDAMAHVASVADFTAGSTAAITSDDVLALGLAPLAPSNTALALFNSALDPMGFGSANTQPKLQGIYNTATALLATAGSASATSQLPISAGTVTALTNLGLTGITIDNLPYFLASVQAYSPATSLDNVAAFQSLLSAANAAMEAAQALAVIANFGNTVADAAPVLHDFATAGITGVTQSLLGTDTSGLLAYIKALPTSATDTVAEVQAIVDAYTALSGLADATAGSGSPAMTTTDFAVLLAGANIGNSASGPANNSNAASLLSSVIDGLPLSAVDTQAELATYANTVASIIATAGVSDSGLAAASAGISVASLTALGITGVTADNLSFVIAAIQGTTAGGAALTDLTALQNIVNQGIAEAARTAALAVVTAYNGTNTAPTLADFTNAAITGVTANNLSALNAFMATMPTNLRQTAAQIQAIVDAFNKLQAAANAAADQSASLTAADYAAMGLTNVSSNSAVNLLNSVIDPLAFTAVDTQPELAALGVAVAGINSVANGQTANPALTTASFALLGITGVDQANLAAVLAAITAEGATPTTLADLQTIVDRAAMVSVISAYNGFNTAPTPASFAAIGVTGVNALSSSQLASLNSLLAGMPSTARDSVAEIQAIVDAFTKLVAAADQQANSSATLTAADYAALGAGNINSTPKVTLLNNIVDALNLTQVNTQAQLQTLANTASGIIVTAAGGTASPALTAADFTAIGVTGVDPTLMPFLLIEIAKTADDGSGVATVAQIQALVTLALDAKAKATPVGPQPQAISLAAVADQILATASGSGQVSITLAPSATSALTVTLTSQTPSVCNVTGYTLNLLTAGSCVVIATQEGDAQWVAADPITISFQIFSAAAPASGVAVQTSVAKGAPLNGAIVSFTPGDLNGSSLVRYLVVATPSKGGAPVTVECSGSPCTVLGLAAGTSYVFRVDTVSLLAGVTSTTSGTPTPAILVPGKFGLLMLVSSPTVSVGSSSGIQYSSILGAPTLEWSSSDASICTVDQFGNVTGIAVGSCVVTAKIVVDAAGTIPYADASATIKIVAATAGFQTLPLVPGPIVPVVVPNPLSAAAANPASAAESGISVPLPANVDGPTNLSVNLPATAGIKSVTVVVTDAAGNEVERITAPVDPVTGQVIFPMSHLAKGYKVAMFTSVPAALVKKTGNVVRGTTYSADASGVIRGANGTYTLVGKKIVPAVTFGAAKWALSKQTRNQLKQFAKYAISHGGRVFVTGFVMHNAGGSVRVEKTIATARARAVGRYLAKLGVNVWINYSGFGAASAKHPKPSDRKVEIRWSQDAAPAAAKTNK